MPGSVPRPWRPGPARLRPPLRPRDSPSRSRRSRRLIEDAAAGARDRERRPHPPRAAATSTSGRRRSSAGSAPRCSPSRGTTTSRTRSRRASHGRGASSSGTGRRPSRSTARTALLVVGLNSVRPWRHQSGRLRDAQLAAAAEVFAEAPRGRAPHRRPHHHLLGAPWRSRKKPVAQRNRVLAALVDAGAELIARRPHPPEHRRRAARVRGLDAGGEHAVVVSIAPGFGQPRPNRRGEARGLHVYESATRRCAIQTYIWRDDGWALDGRAHVPARPRAARLREPGARGRSPESLPPATALQIRSSDERADDRRSQVLMSKNSSSGSPPKSAAGEEAAEQRSDDADDRGHDEAPRVVPR